VVFLYIAKIKKRKPLIHHITNYVVANETANFTLALGAFPVMSHAKPEVEEMVMIADALVLNIGTLDEYQVESMILAGKKANEKGIPVILDPVGAGATAYRTETARRLLKEVRISIIRGNQGEVSILAGYRAEVAGVEAIKAAEDLEAVVKELAFKYGCVVCATGVVDLVSDGKRVARISNGHPMLASVTGTGCMATTINAIYAAVADDYFEASVEAQAAFGIIGELAYEKAGSNPGTFHQSLYDVAYALTDSLVNKRKKVEYLDEKN
jgi:hydroxyethylthiazole kinase